MGASCSCAGDDKVKRVVIKTIKQPKSTSTKTTKSTQSKITKSISEEGMKSVDNIDQDEAIMEIPTQRLCRTISTIEGSLNDDINSVSNQTVEPDNKSITKN
eukprot:CAMPEP_0201582086 /NCGR_PEP_ID=MMETSP0190_2-20130828/79820_1 /ASSEMBLY_ACC=CAM_ASM_000263 /TAXON_ID=37353 /ORGANISM="Rosalina sp." /LENGTH=101 /DNA_ID=CAMNT_0048021295 /DNA_START=41 /DNA_END=343 /DNA_ORIENTATION=-